MSIIQTLLAERNIQFGQMPHGYQQKSVYIMVLNQLNQRGS